MTVFIIILTIALTACTFLLLALLTRFAYNRFFLSNDDDDNFKVRLNLKTVYLLLIAAIFIAIAFLAPITLTQSAVTEAFDFSETGSIGDTVSGLMNPFIAIAGVIVTGLAFYMQYKANLLQRKIFYKQLEEDKSQFKQSSRINSSFFQGQDRRRLKAHIMPHPFVI